MENITLRYCTLFYLSKLTAAHTRDMQKSLIITYKQCVYVPPFHPSWFQGLTAFLPFYFSVIMEVNRAYRFLQNSSKLHSWADATLKIFYLLTAIQILNKGVTSSVVCCICWSPDYQVFLNSLVICSIKFSNLNVLILY